VAHRKQKEEKRWKRPLCAEAWSSSWLRWPKAVIDLEPARCCYYYYYYYCYYCYYYYY